MKCNHSPDTFHPGTTLYLDGDTYTIYLLWPHMIMTVVLGARSRGVGIHAQEDE